MSGAGIRFCVEATGGEDDFRPAQARVQSPLENLTAIFLR